MMLEQTIRSHLQDSQRARDELKTSTLRMLISAIKYFEIAKGKEYKASEQEIIDLIQKEVKKRRESIDMFKTGNRPELAEKEQKELEVLAAYLPKQMSEDEIRPLVKEAIAKTEATSVQDMGKVMAQLRPRLQGRADMGAVSALIKAKLGG